MKKREMLVPDLTPLIDVVFILLIFFIVSSVIKKEELVLNLSLPSSSTKQKVTNVKEFIIELKNNTIALNGKKISKDILNKELENIKNKNTSIHLRIDKKTPYENLINILDSLQKHELNNISLITNKIKNP